MLRSSATVFCVLTLFLCTTAGAQVTLNLPTTYYVDVNAPPGGIGTDTNPFDSIQTALNIAGNGDDIIVRPGTYHENLVMPGVSLAIIGSGGLAATLVDAGFLGRAVTCATPMATSVIPSRLEGLAFRSGMSASGGGLYLTGRDLVVVDCKFVNNIGSQPFQISSGAVATFTNCEFTNNSGTFHMLSVSGGALATLDNCNFHNNSADDIVSASGQNSTLTLTDCDIDSNIGSGIGIGSNATATITGCTIESNLGSGITCINANTTIDSSTIRNNSSVNWGGGVYALFGQTTLRSSQILNNTAPWTGGGCMFRFGITNINNCTVAGNASGIITGGRGLHYEGGVNAVENSIVRGNGTPGIFADSNAILTVSFSDIEGGFAGPNNFDADPLFVDAANGDYHLSPGSPCINTGDLSPSGAPLSTNDFEGEPRIAFGLVDIGSDEYFPGNAGGGQGPRANLALFDINGAGTPNGAPVSSLLPGPYYVRIDMNSNINFDFEGMPNQPVLCMYGNMNVGAATFDPLTGNLDIGGPPDPLTGYPSGITVFIDGTSLMFPGFGAVTDGTGKVSLSFLLPPFPPGILTTFQAAVFRPGGCSITNAVQVEIIDPQSPGGGPAIN